MQFKELKSGYSVYVLDKQNMTVEKCKVTAVGIPHMDKVNPTQMVIDITLDHNGKPATYCMRDSLDITYTGDLSISPNLDLILHEIESVKSQSEMALASVDHHKDIVKKADDLLTDLNPAFKEKKEAEDRFNKIESFISQLDSKLDSLLNKMP